MKIEKLINQEQLTTIIATHVDTMETDGVPIGSMETQAVGEVVEDVMEHWVQKIDRRLAIIGRLEKQKYSPQYRAHFYERGITYNEFRSLFDSDIDEADFQHYPIFEFLQIQSHAQRRRFARNYEHSFIGYKQLLEAAQLKVGGLLQQHFPVNIPYQDICKNVYISGKLGSGKSEVMKHLWYQLDKKGDNSLVLIDPHGDLCQEILKLQLHRNHKDIIYIDPYFKHGYTPTFNPFDLKDRSEYNIEIHSQQIVKVFQELLPKSVLSTQMEALIAPCVATLLRKGDASLGDLQTFMTDGKNQELIEWGIQSPVESHRLFFQEYFSHSSYKITKSSINTKIQKLLNTTTFSNLTKGKNTFDLEEVINEGKIILFNLSKGKMGGEASKAFGLFLVGMLQGIAQKRILMDKQLRKPTFLFIDEFQNFVSPSIDTILTEARKFSLHLILANQTFGDQMDTILKANLLNNTEVKIVGRNGIQTLKPLAQEIGVTVEQLLEMKRFHFCLKSGDSPALCFQSSDELVDNPNYWLRPSQMDALKAYQLQHYYKRLDGAKNPINISSTNDPSRPSTPKVSPSPERLLKPKFDL